MSAAAAKPAADTRSNYCECWDVTKKALAGWTERWSGPPGPVGEEWGRSWHPTRLRAGVKRESHGRKTTRQVSPLATFSQHHAKLIRTHSSGRRPRHNSQARVRQITATSLVTPLPRQLLRQFTPFHPHSDVQSKNKWKRIIAINSSKFEFNAGPANRRSVTYSVNFLRISPWTRHP